MSDAPNTGSNAVSDTRPTRLRDALRQAGKGGCGGGGGSAWILDLFARLRGRRGGAVRPRAVCGVTEHLTSSFRGARSANPESRDFGSGPSDHPGMTRTMKSAATHER